MTKQKRRSHREVRKPKTARTAAPPAPSLFPAKVGAAPASAPKRKS